MPILSVNGITINYTQIGQGHDVVCLHGWDQNISMFAPTQRFLSPWFRVTVLDLPSFGESTHPEVPWGIEEYTLNLKVFCDRLGINEPILIAHSFGARVAILYAASYPVKRVILTGAAGLKPRRGPDYYAKLVIYKTAKQLFKLKFLAPYKDKLSKAFGSADYKSADGVKRRSFIKIVNSDLKRYLRHIHAPTLLVWGDKDEATPLWMGKTMEKLIPDAGLVIFENDGHYAYFNQIDRFHRIIEHFLEKDKTHV